MSFASKVLYTGNGSTTDYNVPMPYISQSHVKVYVNDVLQLAAMAYNWSGASTISFVSAPTSGAAIEIRRNTSPTAILVDFVDGSTLRADDLDTAYLHNYYLSQEYADSFNEVINNALVDVATGAGIVETETDEVIAALVNEMLADAAAAELLAAVSGIDDNAEAILTNSASIVTEQNTRASADSAIASDVTTLTATVGGNTSQISTNQSAIVTAEGDITTLYAKYGVTLNVNGYVTGFAQNNDGTTGTFVILADKFAVVDPSGDPGETEYIPFQIVGGKVRFNANVEIDGNLMVSGTINGSSLINGTIGSTQIGANAITTTQLNADSVSAAKIQANAVTAAKINVTDLAAVSADLGAITAGTITLDTSGYIRGGQTAYNTGTGFFLGYSGGAYKFSIGDGSANYMTWDGTDLTIKGDLVVGEYEASDTTILSATTERSSLTASFVTLKTFTVAKDGVVRVAFDKKSGAYTGGEVTQTSYQITINGTQDSTASFNNTTYDTVTSDITVSAGDVIDIDIKGGSRNPTDPIEVLGYVQNAYIKADVVIAPGGTVDLD